jgi:hypothetical protein
VQCSAVQCSVWPICRLPWRPRSFWAEVVVIIWGQQLVWSAKNFRVVGGVQDWLENWQYVQNQMLCLEGWGSCPILKTGGQAGHAADAVCVREQHEVVNPILHILLLIMYVPGAKVCRPHVDHGDGVKGGYSEVYTVVHVRMGYGTREKLRGWPVKPSR